MNLERREFLKMTGMMGLAGAVGLETLFPALARANESDPHIFLNIRVFGGMDCLMGINPWLQPRPHEDDLFLPEGYQVLKRAGASAISLGPSALSLAPHVSDLAVVNGVFMGTTDVGHPAAQNYITTAKGSPNAPHFVAELAECFRKLKQDQSETILFNADFNTFDLEKLSRMPLQRLKQLALEGQGSAGSAIPHVPISTGENAVTRAHERIFSGKAARALFTAKFKEVEAQVGGLEKDLTQMDVELVAAASFAAGGARFAQVDWMYMNMDSHENFAEDHHKIQDFVWKRLARLLSVLKQIPHHISGKALFPHHVTLAVIGEFGRLPYLNSTKGKDHDFYDNSILLGGRGIKGGTVVGANHFFPRDERRKVSQLSGSHIDYVTGEVVTDGYYNLADVNQVRETRNVRLIRPENILRTLTDVFGADPGAIRLFDKETPAIPGLLS